MQRVNEENPEPEHSPELPEIPDDTDGHQSQGTKPTRVDELPDGSGTDKQGSASDHGQESGSESFDAG